MKRKHLNLFIFCFLCFIAVSYALPWAYMLLRSFMRFGIGLGDGKGLFTFEYYQTVLGSGGFVTYSLNSVFVLAFVLTANCFVALLVGYAFSRYSFPLKKVLFAFVLMTLMVPKQTLMVPMLDLMVKLGLHDSLWAIILPFCADGFNIFLMKQYIDALPKDLEEAARADGAGEIGILSRIVAPLSKPAFSVIIINTAILNWNAFLYPLIFIDTASKRTLPVALAMLSQSQYATDWGTLMAGATVSSLPVIILFMVFQKQIIAGITAGAVKQ